MFLRRFQPFLPCVCESIQTSECEDNVILVEVWVQFGMVIMFLFFIMALCGCVKHITVQRVGCRH